MIAELLVAAVVGLTVHEAAHAWVASKLGDPLPRAMGRVTLDPIEHLELVGSVLVPVAAGLLSGGMVFIGWGKSVELSPFWLGRRGYVLALLAGPASNLALAGLFAAIGLWTAAWANVLLAGLNLLPIPPLDGGRLVQGLRRYRRGRDGVPERRVH